MSFEEKCYDKYTFPADLVRSDVSRLLPLGDKDDFAAQERLQPEPTEEEGREVPITPEGSVSTEDRRVGSGTNCPSEGSATEEKAREMEEGPIEAGEPRLTKRVSRVKKRPSRLNDCLGFVIFFKHPFVNSPIKGAPFVFSRLCK